MRDPTGNLRDARELANQIEQYWHERGHTEVCVWVERMANFNKLHAHYAIRSNIKFIMP
jgi:hypothetical protein